MAQKIIVATDLDGVTVQVNAANKVECIGIVGGITGGSDFTNVVVTQEVALPNSFFKDDGSFTGNSHGIALLGSIRPQLWIYEGVAVISMSSIGDRAAVATVSFYVTAVPNPVTLDVYKEEIYGLAPNFDEMFEHNLNFSWELEEIVELLNTEFNANNIEDFKIIDSKHIAHTQNRETRNVINASRLYAKSGLTMAETRKSSDDGYATRSWAGTALGTLDASTQSFRVHDVRYPVTIVSDTETHETREYKHFQKAYSSAESHLEEKLGSRTDHTFLVTLTDQA